MGYKCIVEKCWKGKERMDQRARDIVYNSKLFRGLTKEEADGLFNLHIGFKKTYRKGEIVITPGEAYGYIGVILSGEMEVVRIYENGSQYQVQQLGKSDLIGMDTIGRGKELNLFFHVAKTDMMIFQMPVDVVLQEGKIPEKHRVKMLECILDILVFENLRQHQKVDLLSVPNMRDRIYRYLSYQQAKEKKKVFEVPFNREQMADYLCVNRSALSRELSNMEKDGIIKYNRNQFELLK